MIGKMFRPLQIISIPDKRGYTLLNKYKSNFGGVKKFNVDIYLDYHADSNSETVNVDFRDLVVPVAVLQKFCIQVSKSMAITSDKKYKISALRQMVRPTAMTAKESLEFTMPIEATKDSKSNRDERGKLLPLEDFQSNKKTNDLFKIFIMPIVLDNREYMLVEVKSETPVVIKTNTDIRLIDGELHV